MFFRHPGVWGVFLDATPWLTFTKANRVHGKHEIHRGARQGEVNCQRESKAIQGQNHTYPRLITIWCNFPFFDVYNILISTIICDTCRFFPFEANTMISMVDVDLWGKRKHSKAHSYLTWYTPSFPKLWDFFPQLKKMLNLYTMIDLYILYPSISRTPQGLSTITWWCCPSCLHQWAAGACPRGSSNWRMPPKKSRICGAFPKDGTWRLLGRSRPEGMLWLSLRLQAYKDYIDLDQLVSKLW